MSVFQSWISFQNLQWLSGNKCSATSMPVQVEKLRDRFSYDVFWAWNNLKAQEISMNIPGLRGGKVWEKRGIQDFSNMQLANAG